jgi:hypothetical protein
VTSPLRSIGVPVTVATLAITGAYLWLRLA